MNPTDDKIRVLIIDDDASHAGATAEALERSGYRCDIAATGAAGAKKVEEDDYDVVLTDLVMRDLDGIEIVRRARARRPDSVVVVITGYPSSETTTEALDEGAQDYLDKPLNLDILRAKMRKWVEEIRTRRENVELRRELDLRYGFERIIGNSEAMKRVFAVLRQVAETRATVLITGESGTGKELVARALHANSPRRGRRFVPINCAALPEALLESELFGHEKGAFTGAAALRKGRFEYAHGGTLFLDEIGDMPAPLQVKLLRVLEDGQVFRVGSNEPIQVDVRLVTATHRNLSAMVKEGKFREDLYYRLKVVTVELPPLRERLEDVPFLVDAFLREFNETHRRSVKAVSPAALSLLYAYPWPGNVRELRNTIESMVVLSNSDTIDVNDVPSYIRRSQDDDGGDAPAGAISGVNLEQAELEKIRQALAMSGGNREKAAEMLGIGERTLYRKIKRYNLDS